MIEPPKNVCLDEETTAGNYFISNYPPYSFWTPDRVGDAHAALERPPEPGTPLGIYLHIPFCRKRCHFCYFKVYTDKDSGEIEGYLDAVVRELTLYSKKPFIGGRKPTFIYFGGGTPSYISSRQLSRLVDAMKRRASLGRGRGSDVRMRAGDADRGQARKSSRIWA